MSSSTRRYVAVQPQSPADENGSKLTAAARGSSSDESICLTNENSPTRAYRTNSSDVVQAVLARDTNATPSVFHVEQRWIGAMLATADGGSSALCYTVQGFIVGKAVAALCTTHRIAEAESVGVAPNALLYIPEVASFLGNMLYAVAIVSARDALRPGGSLEQLKVGEVKIGHKEAAILLRWRMVMGVLAVICCLFGLWFLAVGIFAIPPDVPPNSPVTLRLWPIFEGAMTLTATPLLIMGWWHSMYTASYICRDEIVVRDGWATGLVGVTGFCVMGAITNFTLAINAPFCEKMDAAHHRTPGQTQLNNLVITASFLSVPLLCAIHVAETSTWCDILMEELNDARTNYSPECHLKIQWLETALKQLVRNPMQASFALSTFFLPYSRIPQSRRVQRV